MVKIGKQVASALVHLHSQHIIHRDVRLPNILVRSLLPLHVVVADFGVGHEVVGPGTSTLTTDKMHVGWTPPESFPTPTEPTREVSYAGDVYQVGLVLHQLVTGGKDPWWFAGDVKLYRHTVGTTTSPLEAAAAEGHTVEYVVRGDEGRVAALKRLVGKCLAGKKESRPTMEEVLGMLGTIEAGGRGLAYV